MNVPSSFEYRSSSFEVQNSLNVGCQSFAVWGMAYSFNSIDTAHVITHMQHPSDSERFTSFGGRNQNHRFRAISIVSRVRRPLQDTLYTKSSPAMARPAQGVVIKPTPPTEPRPKPILDGLSPHDFSVEMDNTYVEAFDKDSVILLPLEYIESQDDSASARWHQSYNARRCWQTCIIYERIGETHPRLAR